MPRLWLSEQDKVFLSCRHFLKMWLPMWKNTKVGSLSFTSKQFYQFAQRINRQQRSSLCDSRGLLLHQPITLWSRHYTRGATEHFNKWDVIWAAFRSDPTALIRFRGKQKIVVCFNTEHHKCWLSVIKFYSQMRQMDRVWWGRSLTSNSGAVIAARQQKIELI